MQADCAASLILVLSKVSNGNRRPDFKGTAYCWPGKGHKRSGMAPLGTMWPGLEQRLAGRRGPQPSEPAVPFRGAGELLLGGEVIEAVALSLESELLSSLGHLGKLTGPCAGLG